MPGLGAKIRESIGKINPFNQPRRPPSPGGTPTPSTPPPEPPPPSSNGQGGNPHFQQVEGGKLNLVNYSPEELMQHVNNTLSTVHFGMNASEKFKEWAGEIWDVVGPMVMLCGTAGEVFAFIWTYSNSPAWWVGASVLATVIVLEATFMIVSYKSSTIRNRAEGKPEGATDLEKIRLRRYKVMWIMLALGVGVGQGAFLLSAMYAQLTNVALLITFVIARTVFTLASDYYTAFVHVKKPTDGEEAKSQQQQRATLADALLKQKSKEITIINDGILSLQRAHTNAEIEQDTLKTELEVKKLENKNRIDTLKNQSEQAAMFTQLGNNIMRALFDPNVPDDQRQKLLGTMQGFMAASKELPPGHRVIVEESQRDTGEL